MELLTLAMWIGSRSAHRESSSALPGAPIVSDQPAHPARPHAVRARLALARGLSRAADAVAPAPASHPAH